MAQNLSSGEDEPVNNGPQTNDDILKNLLGGYTKPAIEEPDTAGDEPPRHNTDNQPIQVSGEPIKYYKTGPKAGQPRPNRGRTPSGQPVTPPLPPGEVTISGELLSGALFITLIDLLLPFLIEVINNKFSSIKINSEDLQLSAKQKKEIEPIGDAVAKKLNLSGNPVVLLFIALGGIYGINTAALRSMKKAEMKAAEKKEQEKHK